MASSKMQREVQRLTGRVAALNRFIARSTDRCLPFYNTLRGNKKFEWTKECEEAFQQLKGYLASPPVLAKPVEGEPLFLYTAVSDTAVSGVLIREERGEQKPIFYVSKTLTDAETRYPQMEKLALSVVMSARKLRPYFQSHSIVVLSTFPLRSVLHSPSQSGRLAKWAIELSEYDIEYRGRTCAKSQVLADFLIELPEEAVVKENLSLVWQLHVDGSSSKTGSGVGIRLTSPTGEILEQSFRLGFRASNNEAEYEALIAGMRLAHALKLDHIHAFCDSQLVANQFSGEYATKDERMEAYLKVVQELAAQFTEFILTRIPRGDNTLADALAVLASTSDPDLMRIIPVEFIEHPSIPIPEAVNVLTRSQAAKKAKDNAPATASEETAADTEVQEEANNTLVDEVERSEPLFDERREPDYEVDVENDSVDPSEVGPSSPLTSPQINQEVVAMDEDSHSLPDKVNANTNPSEANEATAMEEDSPESEYGCDTRWLENIRRYVDDGTKPTDKWAARKLRAQAARYILLDGNVFKWSLSGPLLICVEGKEARKIMQEVHSGSCGNHSGGRALALKIKRHGYYWPTMIKDCVKFSTKCDKCQRHAPKIHQPTEMLSSITSPYPFMRWGMDIVGPLHPSRQRRWLLVLTDYFSKWVEAEAFISIKDAQVEHFVWKNIICRHGVPYEIITDNGSQFISGRFEGFCEKWKIRLNKSTPRRPQGNGLAESTNKTLIASLKKRLDEKKGRWADELDGVIWSYRTTPKEVTGETPFALVYGTECVIPVEVQFPGVRRRLLSQEEEVNRLLLLDELDLINERRDQALTRITNYQHSAAKYYNSKVRIRRFYEGDLVLREVFQNTAERNAGKLGATWEGPYRVTKVVRPGVYKIATMAGTPILRSWNATHLKKYYH